MSHRNHQERVAARHRAKAKGITYQAALTEIRREQPGESLEHHAAAAWAEPDPERRHQRLADLAIAEFEEQVASIRRGPMAVIDAAFAYAGITWPYDITLVPDWYGEALATSCERKQDYIRPGELSEAIAFELRNEPMWTIGAEFIYMITGTRGNLRDEPDDEVLNWIMEAEVACSEPPGGFSSGNAGGGAGRPTLEYLARTKSRSGPDALRALRAALRKYVAMPPIDPTEIGAVLED